MSCYHPSFIQRSVHLLTGDVETRFIGGIGSVSKCLESLGVLQESYEGKKVLDFIPRTYQNGKAHDFIQIPCGKCIGCRIDYSRSWADRMTYHVIGREDQSYFITLTYDEKHIENLPYSDNYGLYSLQYDDMTAFIKRLRNRFKDAEIDYYYSGEYGDQEFRPHFHLICYNIEIPDLEFWKLNNNGDPLYTSEIIHGLWKNGLCAVARYDWLNAAYTASYVEKKRDGRAMCEYTAVGIEPEKCRCSRRPGIAHDYYMEHYADIWKNEGLAVGREVNSRGHLGIPRYFRKLAENGAGFDEYMEYKKRCLDRSNILNPLKLENSSFDLDRVGELLKFEEREILSRSKNKTL